MSAAPSDVTYLISIDDDQIPLSANVTIGNQLDNDIVVAGEDVADFHLRVEVTERGPVLIPLGDATVNVNGQETDKPVQVIIGDVIGVGSSTLQIGYELESEAPRIDNWALSASSDGAMTSINGELTVGRHVDAGLCILDTHISRFHARLIERDGIVWLQDLASANGTRINGTRLVGGARLFHGDTLGFDHITYQVIGQGGDLTPVHRFVAPEQGTSRTPPPQPAVAAPVGQRDKVSASPREAGLRCVLEHNGTTYPLGAGETLLGSDPACEIVLAGEGVLPRHARVSVKPEGCVITNLGAPEDVRVDGAATSSARLEADTRIALGSVELIFRERAEAPRKRSRTGLAIVAGGGLAALLVVLLLL